jgi:hypothetical protein
MPAASADISSGFSEALTTPLCIDREAVDNLAAGFSTRWESQQESFPDMGEPFSPSTQKRNGFELEDFFRRMECESLRHEPVETIRRTSQTMIYRLLETDADGEAREILDSFGNAGDDFSQRARKLDPSLSPDDLYQALRNVWIFNSLQAAEGLDVSCTPSCLAYSLLYPYTDNILDSVSLTAASKREFLAGLELRLRGMGTDRFAGAYPKINRCVGMIEEEFPRDLFRQVYEGILSIHEAQVRSLLQHGSAPQRAIRDITIAKGGTSVLADACLVSGSCDEDMLRFAFDFGAALQLVDDLQDAGNDFRHGHHTLFSHISQAAELERETTCLINLLNSFTDDPGWGLHAGGTIGRLFLKGCRRLILEAMARRKEHYSPAYICAMEQYSPVSFSDLSRLRNRYRTMRKKMPDSPFIGKPGNSRTS